MPMFELNSQGQTSQLDLADGDHSVGRAADSAVQISVSSVSKHHAVLRVDGDQLFVRDLGSTNGTNVDGVVVNSEEVEVRPGSTVYFAGVGLRRADEADSDVSSLVSSEDLNSEISYRHGEAFSEEARKRIMGMLSGLFELLASASDATGVEAAACDFVSNLVPADRVVLLEDDGEGTQVRVKADWSRNDQGTGGLRLSTSILNQVLKGRESVLVANVLNDPNFSGNESIVALDLRSAMAAPLFDNERVRGILYIDSADPRVQFSAEDLQVITATANAVAVKLRNLTLEGEVQAAARIQQQLIPEHLDMAEGYQIHAHQVMCRAVGGDLYHVLHRPNGNLLIALGDVAGKGMPAALAMSACMVLLRTLSDLAPDLLVFARQLHHQLFESLAAEQFITLFLAELDPATGAIEYINAGHNPPILVRANGDVEELPASGLPIAMIDRFTIEKLYAQIDPGDLLTIYSDGIVEATRDGDEMLEVEPMLEILKEYQTGDLAEVSGRIITAVNDFLEGEPPSDDVTLMLLRRQ